MGNNKAHNILDIYILIVSWKSWKIIGMTVSIVNLIGREETIGLIDYSEHR